MSEDILIDQCSPTMAGIKTGSLFSCIADDKKTLNDNIRRFNASLVPKGLRLIPMKFENNRALVYMYRPSKLAKDLNDPTSREILSNLNYSSSGADGFVAQLRKKINVCTDFPHEIGLFLGYPPKDVDGFIKKGPHEAKLTGTWKVYTDEESAKKKFALYKKCAGVYKSAYKKHNSFDRLIVREH